MPAKATQNLSKSSRQVGKGFETNYFWLVLGIICMAIGIAILFLVPKI